jgi:hypothetical protein
MYAERGANTKRRPSLERCYNRDHPRYPIAPTKFPTGWSATHRLGPEGLYQVQHIARRRRIPSAGHAREGGYRLGLTPDCLFERFSHRPTIHRLHQGPTARCRLDGNPITYLKVDGHGTRPSPRRAQWQRSWGLSGEQTAAKPLESGRTFPACAGGSKAYK